MLGYIGTINKLFKGRKQLIMSMSLKLFAVGTLTTIVMMSTCNTSFAGGECPPPPSKQVVDVPVMPQQQGYICRDWPIPTPRRYVGFGAKLNPFYTPTYTYPSERVYEGDNPKYYPFFLPRKWANYKSAPVYYKGDYGYKSRSNHYWDSYDEWELEKSEQRQ